MSLEQQSARFSVILQHLGLMHDVVSQETSYANRTVATHGLACLIFVLKSQGPWARVQYPDSRRIHNTHWVSKSCHSGSVKCGSVYSNFETRHIESNPT